MKRIALTLLTTAMILLMCVFPVGAAEENGTLIMSEDFNDGVCAIKNVSSGAVLTTVVDAETGDGVYGKVFKTTSNGNWYIDLGKTFTADDTNVAKISFDVKSPSVIGPNVMFYFGDAEKADTNAYKIDNTEYKKHAFYMRSNGNMGVNSDVDGYWSTPTGKEIVTYTAATWYHIDITVDLYKQTASFKLNGNDWGTASYGNQGKLKSFNYLAAHTESISSKNWQFDNLTVTDMTVEVDETVLFEADFEDVETASDAGVTFAYGAGLSAVEPGTGTNTSNVLRFSSNETTTSRFKVPVNATETENKAVSMSFDLYAKESDKYYCMIYLYDTAGTDYKILVRNSNQAAGQTGYFKFLNIGAPWKPVGCKTDSPGEWVHVDGIFEFHDNQTVVKWYFNGEYAGVTYSYTLKDISYIRFNVNKTEVADLVKTYAIDNIVMRQYDLGEFTCDVELTGEGAGTTLTLTPSGNLEKDAATANYNFKIENLQNGNEATVTKTEVKDGKLVLTLSGIEHDSVYRISSENFTDMFGQKMKAVEFNSLPQYSTDGKIVPAISAVWLTDYDGNRLNINEVNTEVSQIKLMFNTRMMASTMTGITVGDLVLDGTYSSKDNSYTATWGGYLEPESVYSLKATGLKDVNGTVMADYTRDIKTGKGKVSLKDVKVLNASGEAATTADAAEGAVLTLNANVLNTSGADANGVVAYGMYKNSYMTDHNFGDFFAEADKITPITLEIPYEDSDTELKIFAWDEFGALNPYLSEVGFVIAE